jgi:hypothetical protein
MPRRKGCDEIGPTEWRAPEFLRGSRAERYSSFTARLGADLRERTSRLRVSAFISAVLSLEPADASTGEKVRKRNTANGISLDDRFLSDPPFLPEQLVRISAAYALGDDIGPAAWVVDELTFRKGVTVKSPGVVMVEDDERLPRAHAETAPRRRVRRRDAKTPRVVQRALALHAATPQGDPVLDYILLDAQTQPAMAATAMLKRSAAKLLLAPAPVVSALVGLDGDRELSAEASRLSLCTAFPVEDLGSERFRIRLNQRLVHLSARAIHQIYRDAGSRPVQIELGDDVPVLQLLPLDVLVDDVEWASLVLDIDPPPRRARRALSELGHAWVVQQDKEAGPDASVPAAEAVRRAVEYGAIGLEQREYDLGNLPLDAHNHGTEMSWRSHCALVMAAYAFIVAERRELARARTD